VSPAADLIAALRPVLAAFDELGVASHVGGSVASSVQGVARATLDVDVVADLTAAHVGPLVAALRDAYYVAEDAVREAVLRRASFNVIHLETMLKVDVFVRKELPYDQQAFARRVPDTLGEGDDALSLYLATPEDTVLHKLYWYRLGDGVSDRQWRDVLGVLKVQAGRLDTAYLRRWAPALDVADLLERALAEAAD
jgi:hypothetical protein